MSSRRSPAPILAPLRRGSPPRPTVSSPAGRRAGALSFGMTLLGALGAGWCLICTGRALGALLTSSSVVGLLAQALAAAAVSAACQLLAKTGLREQVMIDFSHANSSKQHRRQIDVAQDVASQIANGDTRITGVMIESHLHEGRQDITPGQPLDYGVSVTDACLSMEQTVPVLEELAQAVRALQGARAEAPRPVLRPRRRSQGR